MDIYLIILIVIAYIFAAIGYGFTVKKGFDKKLQKFDKFIIVFFSSIWPLWMIILGFAYTMTEIEFLVKRQFDSRYKV